VAQSGGAAARWRGRREAWQRSGMKKWVVRFLSLLVFDVLVLV
jgi:hypothetical protein